MIGNVYMSHMMEFAPQSVGPELQKLADMVRPMHEEGAAGARDDWTNGGDNESRMGVLMAEILNFADHPPELFRPSEDKEDE